MRTVKHKIKPPSVKPEQEAELLALMRAYQFEKNYWSDQLLNGCDDEINLKNLYTYQQIRNSKNLTKNNYFSHYNLPVRYCTIALKEAYELHIRTYEAQIAFLKRNINDKIYKFSYTLATTHEDKNEIEDELSTLNVFKEFLYFATNSLFYNYKTFRTFEEELYSKKFRKARIYQRIQPILQKLLNKAIQKEVFKLNNDKEANNTEQSKAETQRQLASQLSLQENIKIIKQFLQTMLLKHNNNYGKEVHHSCNFSFACLQQLLNYYCNCLVNAIVKFRNYKLIQSQINPTITLDGSCYELYSVYDQTLKKNRWFLNIMSMEKGKRIKGLELTGFHYAKQIMKHKNYPNLVLSFDSTDMTYYAHLTFPVKNKKKTKNAIKKKPYHHLVKNQKAKQTTDDQSCKNEYCNITANMLMTMLTVGGDFGLTENYTFSDGWVSGRKQGKILNHIANSTKNSVAGLQRISEKGFFGVEKNNPTGKRNHKNNCFNHNQLLDNINENYRKKQRKYNRFLQNYKYLLVNEIIDHFTSDSVYGQYSTATHESHVPVKLVFESLEYTSLGKNKSQKRQVNLIKGILNVLEEKIERYNLPIKIEYVHPGYTSQNCPNCYFVAKANRNSKGCSFRCQHCGFTAIDDERFKWLTKVVQRAEATLPSEDDFIAACNIAERLSTIPDSTRLRLRDIKDRLMYMHGKIKVSCKMFDSSNIKC